LSDGTGQEGGKASGLNTNVYRLFNMLENRTARQVVFYEQGVGTGTTGWRKLIGNAAGAGMWSKIQKSYQFIFDHYERGDRIFLIGFSRGAAMVRSLSGFIDLIGMLPKGRSELIKAAYEIYQTPAPSDKNFARLINKRDPTSTEKLEDYLYPGDKKQELKILTDRKRELEEQLEELRQRDSEEGDETVGDNQSVSDPQGDRVVEMHRLVRLLDERLYEKQALVKARAKEILAAYNQDRQYRDPSKLGRMVIRSQRTIAFLTANHSEPVPIEFLGCFDTVAALGLPLPVADAIVNSIPGFQHKFHDFNLCKNVRHAYHALAIDDVRKPFAPVLWTLRKHTDNDRHECDSPGCDEKHPQTLRQVWFAGMHTDIGGGYPDRGLSDIALAWMLRQAHKHGLLLHANESAANGGIEELVLIEDPADVMANSRDTLLKKLLYRYRQRKTENPVVHETAIRRMKSEKVRLKNGAAGKCQTKFIKLDDEKSFGKEPWVKHDAHELLQAQEDKWDKWMQQIVAKKEARLKEHLQRREITTRNEDIDN
jgi:uncharacterized protein (DUF2235 family)